MERKKTIIFVSLISLSIILVITIPIIIIPMIAGTKPVYIAPYVTYTHNCYTHSSGCTAEFPTLDMNYTITSQDGTVNIDGSATTESNGFFIVNMVYHKFYTITISTIINGSTYTGTTTFDTTPLGADCITTGQLSNSTT